MTEILFARKTDVDSLIISVAAANGAVRYDVAQGLTGTQQAQALSNIGYSGTTGTGTTLVLANAPTLTGQVSINNSGQLPDALLTVNANTGASVAPIAGTNLHIVGADATANRISMHSYGAVSVLGQYHALGTQASKSASASGNNMFAFGANGWNGAAYVASSEIDFFAGETFSGTASGGYIRFQTTPLTTTGIAEAMRIQPSGGVSIGSGVTATDPGLGALLLQTSFKISNTAATSGFNILDVSKDWSAVNASNLIASFTSYGDAPRYVLRRANGTAASTTATLAGDVLGQTGYRGYFVTGGPGFTVGSVAAIQAFAAENYTSTTTGAHVDIFTTPIGASVGGTNTRFLASGGVSIGSTAANTDPGFGNLLVQNFINTGGYARVTSNITVTNSTTSVTAMSVNVAAGQTYGFDIYLSSTQAAAGGIRASLGGTAGITNLLADGYILDGATIRGNNGSISAFNVNVSSTTTNLFSVFRMHGTLTVSTAGTFLVQFAQSTANATGTVVLRGSWFKVWQIT